MDDIRRPGSGRYASSVSARRVFTHSLHPSQAHPAPHKVSATLSKRPTRLRRWKRVVFSYLYHFSPVVLKPYVKKLYTVRRRTALAAAAVLIILAEIITIMQ